MALKIHTPKMLALFALSACPHTPNWQTYEVEEHYSLSAGYIHTGLLQQPPFLLQKLESPLQAAAIGSGSGANAKLQEVLQKLRC